MTPSGIEPATFQFVAQYINHCAIAVPLSGKSCFYIVLNDNDRRKPKYSEIKLSHVLFDYDKSHTY
jgi:hypothetical protein